MDGMRLEIPRYGSAVPGLPDRAIVFTNSERGTAACGTRWLLAVPDRLKPMARQRPLEFGIAWHAWLEDVHRWWMALDTTYPWTAGCAWCAVCGLNEGKSDPSCWHCDGGCPHCNDTKAGPLVRALDQWNAYANADATGEFTAEMAAREADTLLRAAEGWLHTYGADPSPDYKVVGVELKIAVPILSPSGKPYCPQTWVVPDDDDDNLGGLRIAGTGEAHHPGARKVRWPWYQCLTLDALFQHRTSGGLYIGEHKSAASPTRRVGDVVVDPQLDGYVWATEQALRLGTLDHLGISRDSRVEGYRYDVTSSGYQNDPILLKPQKVKALDGSGQPYKNKSRWVYQLDTNGVPIEASPGLSRNRNAGVPSWRYRAAMRRHGYTEADYFDHLLTLAGVDAKLYQRINGATGAEVSARYQREVYTTVKRIATWRRRAATLTTQAERELHFPRTPVCIGGFSCAFKAPCLQDGEMVRRNFDKAPAQRWVPAQPELQPTREEELGW